MFYSMVRQSVVLASTLTALVIGTGCTETESTPPIAPETGRADQSEQIQALPADYDLCAQDNKFLDELVGLTFSDASAKLQPYGFTKTPLRSSDEWNDWKEGISCEGGSCSAHLYLRGDVAQSITLFTDGHNENAKVTGTWGQAYPGQCGAKAG